MKRHGFRQVAALASLTAALASMSVVGFGAEEAGKSAGKTEAWNMKDKVVKSDAEWRKQLTSEQYEVARRKGTEGAFTGKYWNTKKTGSYRCVGCGLELFRSDEKYDSGCGWPSYWQPTKPEHVETAPDNTHGMQRTEVLCARCGAHLGHVFDDGPQPTGLRYCINSASLTFEEKPATKPADTKPADTTPTEAKPAAVPNPAP